MADSLVSLSVDETKRERKFRVEVSGRGFGNRLSTVYHSMLDLPWWKLLLLLATAWIFVHVVFAALFFAGGPETISGMDTNSTKSVFFMNCFFFSIQAGATIGFGAWSPMAFYSNVLVSVESFLQLLWTAVITGIVFMKLSRPSLVARQIRFSKVAVVDAERTKITLRIVNLRHAIKPKITLFLFKKEMGPVGPRYRLKKIPCSLQRSSSNFVGCSCSFRHLSLPFTVEHIFNDYTRLVFNSEEAFQLVDAKLIVLVKGIDQRCASTYQANFSYSVDDIHWDAQFADMVDVTSTGKVVVDYSNLDVYGRVERRPRRSYLAANPQLL
eukprot:TRINITY_DN3613_c0_g1_i1.p1 TRINITY_DN3613_c0_g1~~TRINITY_DN3613_c0_g1_i1.p1  ORF type:complete len:326 (+),score=55.12 TRINITY_DN3613_c0_g1_i1:3-980(+)